MKMKDDPHQAVKAYFAGLAAKDVSSVPWADHATLRTPLNLAFCRPCMGTGTGRRCTGNGRLRSEQS
jgi:hypothetical protein